MSFFELLLLLLLLFYFHLMCSIYYLSGSLSHPESWLDKYSNRVRSIIKMTKQMCAIWFFSLYVFPIFVSMCKCNFVLRKLYGCCRYSFSFVFVCFISYDIFYYTVFFFVIFNCNINWPDNNYVVFFFKIELWGDKIKMISHPTNVVMEFFLHIWIVLHLSISVFFSLTLPTSEVMKK